jgi:hypothetical protein
LNISGGVTFNAASTMLMKNISLIGVLLRTLTIDEENQLVGLRTFAPTYPSVNAVKSDEIKY